MRLKKTFFVFIIIIITIILFSNVSIAQSHKNYPKDPNLALVLSLINPGFGMFYVEQPSLGVLFWATDKALFISTLLTLFDIQISFPTDVGINVELKLRDMSVGRICAVIGLGTLYVGFRIFSFFFAREKALDYNHKLLEETYQSVSLNNRVRISLELNDSIDLGIRLLF